MRKHTAATVGDDMYTEVILFVRRIGDLGAAATALGRSRCDGGINAPPPCLLCTDCTGDRIRPLVDTPV